MDLQVDSTGLSRGKAPESCVLVVFGASGDLYFPNYAAGTWVRLLQTIYSRLRGENGRLREAYSIVSGNWEVVTMPDREVIEKLNHSTEAGPLRSVSPAPFPSSNL